MAKADYKESIGAVQYGILAKGLYYTLYIESVDHS